MLTVVGFPCSGTNFLHRMLAHYLDGPGVPTWDGMGRHGMTQKIHWAYQCEEFGEANVYIYRDPRDCALSGWHYVRQLTNQDIPLMGFLEHCFAGHWHLWPVGWKEHTQSWLAQDIPNVSYEMLCESRATVLEKLVLSLGLKLEEQRLAHAVAQSYTIGKRNDGRWAKELPQDAAMWLGEYCGDLMRSLGYIWRRGKDD